MLWRLAVLPIVAVILGGLQRLAVQAVRLGWLPDDLLGFLLEGWQIAQSAVVAAIGIYILVQMRLLAGRLLDVETVVGDMVDRVNSVNLDDLNLTRREREVLSVVGTSSHIDDKTLAEKLGVSSDTAHTHISSLLKKTKLRDRRDLLVVAFLLKAHGETEFRSR
jgi:DNA-binding CsgD family transcriptional regulator